MTRCRLPTFVCLWLAAACGGARTPGAYPLARCTHDGDCAAAQAGCDAGDANACTTLGYLYGTATKGAVAYHQPERGEAYLARACGLSVLACDGVVDVAEHQRATCEDDYAGETRLVVRACDAGYPPACAIVANKLVDGVDLPRDTARAAALYAKICDEDGRFPDFVETDGQGRPVPHADPLAPQVTACVRSRRLVELGLADARITPQRTAEQALELERARAGRYRHAEQWPSEQRLDEERRAVEYFADPAERIAANVIRAREAGRGGFAFGCRSSP